jgi:acetyl coenzyme A synthetase (ADP forming)-like protein
MPLTPALEQLWDVVLRDGSTLTLRATRDADVPALVRFFQELSPESRYYRFLGSAHIDTTRVRHLIVTDESRGASLVGESGGRIVAFAGFYRRDVQPDTEAEIAFAIADVVQGRGLGTRLLELLADIARPRGIRTFHAYVLGENQKMMRVFFDSGYEMSRRLEEGVYQVSLSLDRTPHFFEKQASRSQTAAAASMKHFFEPRVVAVVGANRERGKIGSEIFHNLRAASFAGTVVPVHPTADEIDGVRAYPRVSSIDGPVDLAIIASPAAGVLDVVNDCIDKGVPALCVISAGFSEVGPAGRAREAALLDRIRSAGCRLIGPNCMGLLNTDPAVRLNGTFSPVYPPAGGVAMSTQSGALGLAILEYAQRLHIGISSFVSVGNKIDVSSNDLIQYWADDPHTSVILLYLESFGNPRKFSEIARRVARIKPIVAVKSGRSTAGARAAASHTGALAASDAVVDALFRQAGVIRTETLEELFDVAVLVSHQPVPRGPRVAILTNAGGPGILAADACEASGLALPALSDATCAELRSFLPAAASVGNPVDMLASAPPEHYARALATLLRDDRVDSVLTIFVPPLVTESRAVAAAIKDGATHHGGKPVAAVFMGPEGGSTLLGSIPSFTFPESAVRALARVTSYGAWRSRPPGTIETFDDIRAADAQAIVRKALERGGGWLTPQEADDLLNAAGIATASARVVRTGDDAAASAVTLGFPVVVKAIGPGLLHKTERQAVVLDLRDEAAVKTAFTALSERLGHEMSGALVQRMVRGGVEMLVGAVQDPTFGPIVTCGSGGVLVELLEDYAFRLHPLTAADATEMIDELRAARLLRGFRGAAPLDEAALENVVLRVSSLLSVCPEIQELDINPVKVLETGACAVDARVRVGKESPRPATRRIHY